MPSNPTLPPSLLDRLAGIVGERWVLTEPDRLLVYEADAQTAHNQVPQAVVLPASTQEVAQVFRVLDEAGVPVVPRGAGTGLSGGALCLKGGGVVGCCRSASQVAGGLPAPPGKVFSLFFSFFLFSFFFPSPNRGRVLPIPFWL